MPKLDKTVFIIDFDSTFVTVEALDELATIALQDNPHRESLIAQISHITHLGMEGKITFPKSLAKRLALFSANKSHISHLIPVLERYITPSFADNKNFFKANAHNIYIISGGFKEYIYPVVKDFGIKENHVLANTFIFDEKGTIIGFDPTNPLAQENGKVKAMAALNFSASDSYKPEDRKQKTEDRLRKKQKAGSSVSSVSSAIRHPSSVLSPLNPTQIYVIGDGYTDYQIKQHGYADKFFAFTENISRPSVVANADSVLDSLHTFLQLHHEAI